MSSGSPRFVREAHPSASKARKSYGQGALLLPGVLSDDKGIGPGLGAETHQFHGGGHSTNTGSNFHGGDIAAALRKPSD